MLQIQGQKGSVSKIAHREHTAAEREIRSDSSALSSNHYLRDSPTPIRSFKM